MISRISPLLLAFASLAHAQAEWGETLRLKVTVGGQSRKVALFVPRGIKKNQALPLVVAVPNEQCKAFMEIEPWAHLAFENKFFVFSVDTITGTRKGWHYKEQLEMSRDMEAVTEGLKVALDAVKQRGLQVDLSATIITGWSGGAYLAAWLGVRRPDLFMGVCLRGPVFHKETVVRSKIDMPPDLNQRFFIYRGELDSHLVIEQADVAVKALRKAGYKTVDFKIVPKADHKSMPEVCAEWYAKILKETAKGRSDARKIAADLVKVKEAIDKHRAGAYGKLQKLVDREKRAGFAAGAIALMNEVLKVAQEEMERADNLAADNQLVQAVKAYKVIERTYTGLAISKEARNKSAKLRRSDAFKALEMLRKAKEYREKGNEEKAKALFEKIATKYPKTPAGEEAAALLGS